MTSLATAETLRRSGFARLGRILSAEMLAQARDELEQFSARSGWRAPATDSEYGEIRHNVWREVDVCRQLVEQLAPTVLQLLGWSEVLLFQDVLVSKPPGTVQEVRWHQDYSYWPLQSSAGLTTWVALDDARADNGCLQYLPGTHTLGERAPADFVQGAPQSRHNDLPPLDPESADCQVQKAVIAAGDGLAHHPLVWHQSSGNLTTLQRRALSQTWVHPDNCWNDEHAPHPYQHELRPRTGTAVQRLELPIFSSKGRVDPP
jgi:ectoine hydroxylase-related dioxygenase (phytanoyl-CoA dioxygenase family)